VHKAGQQNGVSGGLYSYRADTNPARFSLYAVPLSQKNENNCQHFLVEILCRQYRSTSAIPRRTICPSRRSHNVPFIVRSPEAFQFVEH
jgi:hypothetical protein